MDGEHFRLVSFLNTKLWCSKFIELDVCGRPHFANPVTYAFKVYDNFLEAFQVVLKALLGLIIPNQYCQGTRNTVRLVLGLARKVQIFMMSNTVLPYHYHDSYSQS